MRIKAVIEYVRAVGRFVVFGLLVFLLSCASIRLETAVTSQDITIKTDVVEALLSLPSINNRNFDRWVDERIRREFQQFRTLIIQPQLFSLLEQGTSYLYKSSHSIEVQQQFKLVSLVFETAWANLATLERQSRLSSVIYWLKREQPVEIHDIFIDPADIYQKIYRFAAWQLNGQYLPAIIEQVIQPDRSHIPHILLSDTHLSAIWPAADFQDQLSETVRVDIPWGTILDGRPFAAIIAREFLLG